MDTHQNKVPQNIEKLQEIPKWTRKYAQNRTLTNLAHLVIILIIFLGIAVLSRLAGIAFITEHMILFLICISALLATLICLFIISIPKFGIIILKWIDKRIYGREGSVSISEPESMKKKKWIGQVVGLVFGLCVVVSVFLGSKGYLSIEYMQPISALYVVPFMVFLYFWQRPMIAPLKLLWPALYTIHAILIVTGVPILFTGSLTPLNMILPIFGYGFLTYIIGYIYSRYALKKLKGFAHLEGDATDGD
jgi:hypothetical protein